MGAFPHRDAQHKTITAGTLGSTDLQHFTTCCEKMRRARIVRKLASEITILDSSPIFAKQMRLAHSGLLGIENEQGHSERSIVAKPLWARAAGKGLSRL